MRSLAVYSTERLQTNVPSQVHFMKADSLSEVVFLASNNEVFSFSLRDRQVSNSVKVEGKNVISIEYLLDDECVSLATSEGDLFEWRVHDGSLACVGAMASGISCVQWSPDQDVFALTTGDDKLVLMTRELDPYFETDINPQDFGEAELVTVGWGKRETQFHGTEGKPTAADLKPKVADPALPWDDGKVRISWCDDGQYFSVSSVDPYTGSRKIRVRSRDGTLYSTNEVVPGLEHPIHWRPSGNLIASSQRKPNKHDIVFFEKNGLRHGEFTLPFKPREVKVVELSWNKSSEILAVWLEELRNDADEENLRPFSTLQLWTRNNYHWYLKQEYRFSSVDLHLNAMLWDPEASFKLHLICNDCVLYQVTLKWSVIQSKDNCVAVIDGSSLLLTPFGSAVVPPPMSLLKETFQSPVNQVCFGKKLNEAVVVSSDGTLYVLKISTDNAEPKANIQSLHVSRNDKSTESLQPLCFGFIHLTSWIDNSFLAICKTMKGKDALCCIEPEGKDRYDIFIREVFPINKSVLAVSADASSVAIELIDGSVFTCEKESNSTVVKPWLTPFGTALRFPIPCQSIAVIKFNQEEIVIGMSDHFRLFVNEKQIADNCTSFAIHDDHLVFTTHTHTLRCLQLDSVVKFAISDSSDLLQGETFCRNLERGSKIVSAVCNDTKVVLQMPRGNLETIHPRAMVISHLKKLLNMCLYKDAMTMMKRHRINLNLIYDHNPQLFISNVPAFIASVKTESDVNLFLADIQEDDVTKTFYESCYGKSSAPQITRDGSKVDRICSSIRHAIQNHDSKSMFLCLLTSYAKQSKPDLEKVLKLIKSLKDGEAEATVTFERALKHILYLADVNELYRVALGLYDFDIVLMVAEKSNKDPKEYLPFLNELRSFEVHYSRFRIDCYLKRHKKALSHLYECGEAHFDECLEFINSHELYNDALRLSRNDREHYKRVSLLYGIHLLKNKYHMEAGIVFSRVNCHEEAKDSFLKGHSWKLAIAEAVKLQYSKDGLVRCAKSIAENMKDLKRWKDVGSILELYTEDCESAILAYLNGNLWQDAFRLIQGSNRLDVLETNFKPALMDSFNHHHDVICKARYNFVKYKERLAFVRTVKKEQFLETSDGGIRDEIGNDMFSETSSMTGQSAMSSSSRGSRSSGHSSKSRRKYQRKKYSLKEGSRFEDFALLEALAEIVNSADNLQDDVGSLLPMLILFSYENEASSLQDSFDGLLLMIKNSMTEIWRNDSVESETRMASGPQLTVNNIVRNWQTERRMESEMNTGLPEPTKPILRSNVSWKLQNLL